MRNIENLVNKLADDFFDRIFGTMSKEDYFSKFSTETSPFDNLYNWHTTNHERASLYRGTNGYDNSSHCFELSTLNDMVSAIKFALNNESGFDSYKSFSECLHIALFRYKGDYLEFCNIKKNCVIIKLHINCFNLLDVDNKYFWGEVFVEIPLSHIFDKESVYSLVYKEVYDTISGYEDVYEDMFDVDSIEFSGIAGFNVALKNIKRDDLKKGVLYSQHLRGVKPIVSYKKDEEVIVFEGREMDLPITVYKTSSREITDSIRLYYLLRLFGYEFTADLYYEEIYDKCNKNFSDSRILSGVDEYLNRSIELERLSFRDVYWNTCLRTFYEKQYFVRLIEQLKGNNYITESSYDSFKKFMKGKTLL